MQKYFINISLLLIMIISMSGYTILLNFRIQILILALILMLISCLFLKTLKINRNNGMILLYVCYLIFSLTFALDRFNLIKYIFVFLLIFLFSVCNVFTEKRLEFIIKFINLVTMLEMVSVYFSFLNFNLFVKLCWPFLGKSYSDVYTRVSSEIVNGYYSGLAGEKAEAAFILMIGIGLQFVKLICSENQKVMKTCIWLAFFLIALFLTGKRMQTVATIFVCGVLFFLRFFHSKRVRNIGILILLISALIVVLLVFNPEIGVVFSRIYVYLISSDKGAGRSELWLYAVDMIKKRPIFGYGYGSYNMYTALNGFTYYGEKWSWEAHNCYLQILAENGIVGFTLLAITFGSQIIKLWQTIKELAQNKIKNISYFHEYYLYFSFFCIAVCMIYAITGNVLIYIHQLLLVLVVISSSFELCKQVKV